MDDRTEPQAQDLGRTYANLLEQHTWEVDGMDELTTAPAETAAPPSPPSPERIIEALLFVGGPPLTAERASEAIRGLEPASFHQAVEGLNRAYRTQGRPYHVQAQEGGYVLTLRPRFRPVLERLYGGTREARLSPPAIDVLALVAYRQPASKAEVDSLRGADSGSLLRQLVRRGLVAVVQRGEPDQKEVRYGTTARFLHLFGLKSLDDLPQTQDLQKL